MSKPKTQMIDLRDIVVLLGGTCDDDDVHVTDDRHRMRRRDFSLEHLFDDFAKAVIGRPDDRVRQ